MFKREHILLVSWMIVAITVSSGLEQLTLAGESRTAMEKLMGRLRSEDLRRLALQRYPDIRGKDIKKANSALDVFHDLGALDVLEEALVDPFDEVKTHAALLLADSVEPGDVALTQHVLERITWTTFLVIGGSEVKIPRLAFRRALVVLLAKLTGLPVDEMEPDDPANVQRILESARAWLAERGSTTK